MVEYHPQSFGVKRIAWRQPSVLWAFLGWVVAGPLNPAAAIVCLFTMMGGAGPGTAVFFSLSLVGIPAGVGVALALVGFRSGQSVGDLSRRLFVAAIGVACLYASAIMLFREPSAVLEPQAIGFFITGAGLGIGVGAFFWVPAFFFATLILQRTAFQRYADEDGATDS